MSGLGLVRVDRVGDVAVLVLSHPPVNALSADLRRTLAQALQDACADPEITAIVLRGDGKGFSAGADIAELGRTDLGKAMRLGDLCLQIEAAPKPVIAALHGMALGGGLELALAAHYRIASVAAQLGLPEVALGLLPGAGGTQRLPRLIGATDALRLILTGTPIRAAEALALGLVDRVVEQGLAEAALAMACEALPPRRTCDQRRGFRDMIAYQAAVATARQAHATSPLPAPGRIIDCIEAAALLPFAQGVTAEQVAFADLLATPQAAGLRHAFFTERRAALPSAAVAARGVPPIARLGLWGAGDMAADLAFQALTAGLHLVWAHPDRPALVQSLERTAARQEQAVASGIMTEDTRDTDWARLTTGLSEGVLQGADLILTTSEAATLLPGVPALAVLGALSPDGDDLAAINPPDAAGGLAELGLRPDTPPDTVALLLALARRLGWRVAFAGPGGPMELHLRQALAAAVDHMLAQGLDPARIAATEAALGLGSGVAQGSVPAGATEILTTCMAALAAEGARMVQDGRARRPLDVDAVALGAGLMPRWLGGPMFQADQRGLLVLRADLRRHDAAVFAAPQLLDDLITEGQNFASLNGR